MLFRSTWSFALLFASQAATHTNVVHGFTSSSLLPHQTPRVIASATRNEVPDAFSNALRMVVTDTVEVEETVNPRLEGLALMLDDGTRKSHSVAQNSAFVSGFFRGLSNKRAYRNLLTSLYFVYTAMEDSFDKTLDPCVKSLDDPELRRLSALQDDMDYFYGSNWRETIRASPATKAYVARIEKVAETKPYLLVGHQYSRYLGDLFGGQMMGGMAQRSLDLEENKGIAFYQFEDIPSTKAFITDWYERLNQLGLTNEQREEIVDEANYVFALNIAILDELEGSPLKAMWTLAWNSIKLKLGL